MKKTLTLIAAFVLLAAGAVAQKLSYSAVVRDSDNKLVANQNITVAIAIANSENDNPVYGETHSATTNQNGLVTLTIGEGTDKTGSLSAVTWSTAHITSTFTLPGGAQVVSTAPANAVPYALYADSAGSVDYSNISNTPDIHNATLTIQKNGNTVGTFTANASTDATVNVTVPTRTSDLENNSGYITQSALDNLASQYQHLLDSLGGVVSAQQTAIAAQQAAIEEHQRIIDSLIDAGKPKVTTAQATDVTETSATLHGNVSNPDNVVITKQGFEWKATTGGTYAQVEASGATMTYNLTGLTAGTSYTYRAFVTYGETTAYGDEVTFTTAFTCGTSTAKDYDGNFYNTVQIGSQCWMKQNLRTTHYSDGTEITPGGNNSATGIAYYYDYSSSGIPWEKRGYLYNWPAVMHNSSSSSENPSGVQGICPTGWHVPSDAEWNTLEQTVSELNGLSWQSSWNTQTSGYRGEHASKLKYGGFSAVLAGDCDGDGAFGNADQFAYFWSSTEYNDYKKDKALIRYLSNSKAGVVRIYYTKWFGLSVRCLRD